MSILQANFPTPSVGVNQAMAQTDVGVHCFVTQAVLIQLRSSPYSELRSVRCEFVSGQLYLEGHVPTYYMKQLAQETIRAVDGVEVIVNRVVVWESD